MMWHVYNRTCGSELEEKVIGGPIRLSHVVALLALYYRFIKTFGGGGQD